MKKLFLALLCLLLIRAEVAEAQMMGFFSVGAVPTGYQGPGDLFTFTAWYSCTRGYSQAKATAHANACLIRRPADGATCQAVLATAGNVDYTVGTPCNSSTQTVSAWLGSAGSVTACLGSTAACTSNGNQLFVSAIGSGSVTVGSLVTGVGAPANTYIISGTCPSAPCTMTVSTSTGHGSSGTATLAQSTGTVQTMSDQTAGNACASSTTCDITQATTTAQPTLILNCVNSLPCVQLTNSTISMAAATTFTPNAAAKLTINVVGDRTTGTGAVTFINEVGASASNRFISTSATANSWSLTVAGTNVAFAPSDNAWHTANATAQAGTNNTSISFDGGSAATSTHTPGTTAGAPNIAGASGTTDDETEFGFADNFIATQTQRANLCSQQNTEYNLGFTCTD